MSNEIIELCNGYSRINKGEEFGRIINKFYNEKDPIRLVATPWKMLHKEQSSIAVLCCHGYTGTPGELVGIGLKLYNSGFDVYTPRLPGHGSSQRDFMNSDSTDWIDCEFAAAKYLNSKYDTLYIVGHSMGGLIALIIANELKLTKMALVAPATDIIGLNTKFAIIKLRLASLFNIKIKTAWKSNPKFFGICERNEGDDEFLGSQLWSFKISKSLIKLNKIRKRANRCMKSIESDTLVVLGTADESVSQNSIDRFQNNLLGKLKVISIKDGGHLVLYSNDKIKSQLCNNSIVKHFCE